MFGKADFRKYHGEEEYLVELEEREDAGLIEVEWSAEPYGTVKMEVHYRLYQKGSENLNLRRVIFGGILCLESVMFPRLSEMNRSLLHFIIVK